MLDSNRLTYNEYKDPDYRKKMIARMERKLKKSDKNLHAGKEDIITLTEEDRSFLSEYVSDEMKKLDDNMMLMMYLSLKMFRRNSKKV